jgi:hypothetical protein
MNRELAQRRFAAAILLSIGIAAISLADPQPTAQDSTSNTSTAAALQQGPADASPAVRATRIIGLCDGSGNEVDGKSPSSVGLSDVLWVVVETSAKPAGAPTDKTTAAQFCKGPATEITPTDAQTNEAAVQLDASQYALFFDGRELEALDGTVYDSSRHAFKFRLRRNDQNKAVWTGLLGSPTTSLHRSVTVALGTRAKDQSPLPTISGDGTNATFQLRMFSPLLLAIAVAMIVLVVSLVWGHAKKRTTLRDNLLPQLEPARQPYSLARWQMAFWFTLIFASFFFLFILLWDTNTISSQALALMGISGATALASVAIDVVKNSPADAANRGLQALGLNHYDDVVRMRQEIAAKQTELATPSSTEERRKQLQAEIQDRNNILRMYDDKVRPFASQGWFTDITYDLNGTALHRLQVLCWTIALGVVFLISVYRELSMPDFNGTLLALMSISSAGYVGFKIPEANN